MARHLQKTDAKTDLLGLLQVEIECMRRAVEVLATEPESLPLARELHILTGRYLALFYSQSPNG